MATRLMRSRVYGVLSKMGVANSLRQSSWGAPVGVCRSACVSQISGRGQPFMSEFGKMVFANWRSLSTEAEADAAQDVLDFPGGKVMFTPDLNFIPESTQHRVHCYRILNDEGQPISESSFQEVDKEVAVKIYTDMVTLQVMDTIFYEAQRQGRISFYLTTIGEEAINVASAAALTFDDVVFAQYREPGVLLWRGFTLQEFANQCFGNTADYGKGRQMPIHYGTNKLKYFTVSSPIATQIPHAVGAAYSLKMDREQACAVTYFGDGGTSEVLDYKSNFMNREAVYLSQSWEPGTFL